jgi:hypothetical protein
MWTQIPNFETLYEINEYGDVKSCPKKWKTGKNLIRKKDEHLLKCFIKMNGYKYVCLSKNGVRKQYSIHYLMAKTFIPNIENKKCVNHKDGNKLNNNISNLEWATYSENNRHSLINKLRINPSGKDNGYSVPVEVITNNERKVFDTIKDCAKNLNLTYNQVYYILTHNNSPLYKIQRLSK